MALDTVSISIMNLSADPVVLRRQTLLSINIPTFKRHEAFSRLINQISFQLASLDCDLQDTVVVNVFDNDSPNWQEKLLAFREVFSSSLPHAFTRNTSNIGMDLNIVKCCSSSQDSVFTWVLGDDEQLHKNALEIILKTLIEKVDSLGLLILCDKTYKVHTSLSGNTFKNYEDFAATCVEHQPHVLLAHTLISCNIFRSSLFSKDEGYYVATDLRHRQSLALAAFPHMRGLLHGLLRDEGRLKSVELHSIPTINTSQRLPTEGYNVGECILDIYYFYIFWLLSELGVKILDLQHGVGMDFLFQPSLPQRIRCGFGRLRAWAKVGTRARRLISAFMGTTKNCPLR